MSTAIKELIKEEKPIIIENNRFDDNKKKNLIKKEEIPNPGYIIEITFFESITLEQLLKLTTQLKKIKGYRFKINTNGITVKAE